MKKINKKLLKGLERVMRNEAVRGIEEFPPSCLGIWHQPKRPSNQKKMIKANGKDLLDSYTMKYGNPIGTFIDRTALSIVIKYDSKSLIYIGVA